MSRSTTAELSRMIAHVERTVKASPKWLGGVTRGAANARRMLDGGYDFVTSTADTW